MEFLLAFGGSFAVFPQSVSHVWVENDKVKIGWNESLLFNHLILGSFTYYVRFLGGRGV